MTGVSEVRSPRLADRLAGVVADALVGRTAERERLVDLLTDDEGPAIVFVHGPGGIGKTVLVQGVLDQCGGWVLVDGRRVEPTPAGFLRALSQTIGIDAVSGVPSVHDVATALDSADTAVLAIDSYERLGIIDGWLRNDLLPALPARMRTVVAGRNPPNFAWRAAAGWRSLVAEQVVGPLTEGDAAQLLRRRRLPATVIGRALRFGRGHPLALQLAAEALSRRVDLDVHDGPPPEVVEELVDVMLDDLSPTDRRLTEGASVLRRITQPLLAAVIDDSDPARVAASWRMLRDLPFTAVTADGLEFNALILDVIATAFELRDPGLAREIRRRAARAALAEVNRSAGWGPTADLLHLVQNPIIRDAFVPPEGFQHPVEVASHDDRDAVLTIVDRYHGTAGAELAARWWDAHRDCFVVSRGERGQVTAVSVVVEVARIDPGLWSDPIAAAVLADLRDRPLGAGERALFNRLALTSRRGSALSRELAPMLIDIKRTYLEMRPDLARVYVVRAQNSPIAAMMRALGFRRLTSSVEIGGVVHEPCVLEFGPGSVDAWLARLVEAETSPPIDTVAATSTVTADSGWSPGSTFDPSTTMLADRLSPVSQLSPREREVLAALADGLTNNELAERLFISERTANRHLSNIFTKLGVRNRTAAARIAVEAGIVG
jgi:DNA-binding CsgD family transcriptional regulator